VAPPNVAFLLKLQPETKAFLRQRAWLHEGEINDLASLWMPMDLAAGTDLASPDLLDQSLRNHLQERKNVLLDHVQERILARHPTGEEAELLDLNPDEPVLETLLTVMDVTGTPVVVLSAVRLGDDDSMQDSFRVTDGFRSNVSIESMPES
jgi:GntR family transcriptional regulator